MQVSPENVVGRDQLIERIWAELKKHSLRFTAERRIGKTTVMRKMLAEPQDGHRLLFLDLEKAESPHEFTEALLNEMQPLFSAGKKATDWLKTFVAGIGGVEVAGVIRIPEGTKIGWKGLLEKTFDAACSQNPDTRIVLLLDELPYMLQKIAAYEKRAGAPDNAALEVLDSLRAARHEHPNLRMIFAGSVGLHHVLAELRGTAFASQPINDMPLVEIGPLTQPYAVLLCQRLLDAEKVRVTEADRDILANELAELTDQVPFYLERIVTCLADSEQPISVKYVRQVVAEHLTDHRDAWEMKHFRNRLGIYYPGSSADVNGKPVSNASLASAILDILAIAPQPQTIDEVWAAVKAKAALDNRDQIIQLLDSLAQDHYLVSDTKKRYSFRFPLVRKWWGLAQGISQ